MATKKAEGAVVAEEVKGALYQSLNRNNAQIKRDRAESIGEDLEMEFRRGVQDAAKNLKRAKRERESMYDLSPTNTQTLVLAADLDAGLILQKDTEMSLNIRNLEIILETRVERYEYLFGRKIDGSY